MENHSTLISRAKESALSGKILDKRDVMALLEIDPNSDACKELGQAARYVAAKVCNNKAYLWAAIGIDYRACPMNCDYCSLGESWGLVRNESELTEDEVIQMAEKYVHEGVKWIVLRTTQFYSFEKLMDLARKIKSVVAGNYQLVANAGEFNESTANKLVDAGFEYIYHTVRLREGINTKFDPEERKKTLKAIQRSSLNLVSLIEPIGVEHSNEEIADSFFNAIKYGAVVTGAMARVPVKGTPLGELPGLSNQRLAQIIAVSRLAAGVHAPDICVHPASELAIAWGANVAVVESGSIPRDTCCSSKEVWNGFDPETAQKWFHAGGYEAISNED
ncbi:radical SAM protein [Acetobacterium bakii]|uniref:Radical SAM protein n=2 Tax=Acetobacterium bakii TaxID=52689 RepID=A0A0L6TVA5_9FIRM|nr:radical SAM protein [Acetobacterium bakii]KNZ40209.1 radical SAM protein [Acetobacterium bakii]